MRNDLIHRNCQSKSVGRYVTEDFRKHHEICAFRLSIFLSAQLRLRELTVHAKVCAAACLRPYGKFCLSDRERI